MANDLLLAIDGGQTSSESLLVDSGGRILALGHGGPMDHVFVGAGERARAAIHQAIQSAFTVAGGEPVAATVVAGMTGVGRGEPELAKLAAIIAEVVQAGRIVVVPDYVASLAGASAGGPGVVVVAGGGAVAYARNPDGRDAVAGGYGYLLGDEGGGYDIGRRAIAAAIRAQDGRGAPTALEPLVMRAFNLAQLDDIKRVIYVPAFSRDQLAALVPLVAGAARDGDPVAGGIMQTAGEELAQIGLAAAHMVYGEGEPIHIYPTGGVFRAGAVLCRPFEDAIQSRWSRAVVRAAQHSPVTGALLLAAQLYGIDDAAAWLARSISATIT